MSAMKRILWLGNAFFSDDLRRLGWEVTSHRLKEPTPLAWPDLLSLSHGQPPDVLILSDQSMPTPLIGLEAYPCLTVFHCIDSHIHSWYPAYAQAFDLCALSLKDHLPRFMDRLDSQRLLWLPAFARNDDGPLDLPKEWPLLFVGHINPETTPGRYVFLKRLREKFPEIHITTGAYKELFSRSRLVLNYAEKGDLNFRVFEALGCGACLVTPRMGHGLSELFEDGNDLLLYDQDNMNELLALVTSTVVQPAKCRRIAARGLTKVDERHRARHRAAQVDAWIRAQPVQRIIADRLQQAREIHQHYLKLIYLHLAENLPDEHFRRTYLEAAQKK